MRAFARFAILSCFSLFPCLLATQVCYFPNGNPPSASQPTLLPCNTTINAVHCCNQHDACLANGLCWGGSIGFAYRGGCTEKTWESPNCPNYCNDQYNNTWANLWPCPPRTDGKNWWCGNQDNGICSTSTSAQIFAWPTPGSVQTVLNLATTTTGPDNAFPGAATSNTPAGSSGAATRTGNPTVTVTAASSKDNTAVAIGAGVGVPLGVLVLGFLGFLCWRERKKSSSFSYSSRTGKQQQATWQDKNAPGLIHGGEMSGEEVAQEMPVRPTDLSQELDGNYKTGKA